MKQNKGIIRNNQKKSDRNSDADKLDQICMALADIGYSFSREVYLVFDTEQGGKLIQQSTSRPKKYEKDEKSKKRYKINNCDIVVKIEDEFLFIELDGEAIHGTCDCESAIGTKNAVGYNQTITRNNRYTQAGLNWFPINESLAKFVGLKKNYGEIVAFIALSYVQKVVAKKQIQAF